MVFDAEKFKQEDEKQKNLIAVKITDFSFTQIYTWSNRLVGFLIHSGSLSEWHSQDFIIWDPLKSYLLNPPQMVRTINYMENIDPTIVASRKVQVRLIESHLTDGSRRHVWETSELAAPTTPILTKR